MAFSKTQVAAVLNDYYHTKLTVQQISRKHKVSTPTIAAWVKKAGTCVRIRGRRYKTKPDPRDKLILSLREFYSYRSLAKRFRTTPQNIQRIVKQWRDWKPV